MRRAACLMANCPSTLLMCGICDAFTCGQLVALAEHRAVVKARIWDVDPFAKEIGSSLRSKRTETLKDHLQTMFGQEEEEEEEDHPTAGGDNNGNNEGINLSTKTILRHYANMVRDQRI
jgi:glucose-6-phosphate isomerase